MNIPRHDGRPRTSGVFTLALLPLLVLAGTTRSEAQTRAYVTHGSADLVTAVDTATETVAGTAAVGTGPVRVAITRDGTRAYVANGGSASISVIDTATDAVTQTIAVGDNPAALAVTPDGKRLYVMTAGGVVEVIDAALGTVAATIPLAITIGGPVGTGVDIAITPDGARAYVAAGLVHVIDTASNTVVHSFAAEVGPDAHLSNDACAVAFSPDGSRAYVGVTTWSTDKAGFSGSVILVDTASESAVGAVNLFAMPGAIAVTPDGSRVYVGIRAFWADTGYGAAPFNGRTIAILDTISNALAGQIDLGAAGPGWNQQNTAAGIGVTPDRRAVYAAIPRLGAVAVAGVSTNTVASLIAVTAGPGHLAIVPDATAVLVPYVVDAADDAATATTTGGTPIASVLANDRFGGLQADLAHVTLTLQSSEGLTLDPATGAVHVAAGAAVGVHTLVYQLCEIAAPSNCDDATVTVTVRTPSVIDAVDDSATTLPGRRALVSVLANDTIDGQPAAGRVTLSTVSSTSPTIQLDVSTGAVYVWVGTVPGPHTLTYRICDITSPPDCDTANVAITVTPFPIDAVNDTGAAPRSGGTAVANVLANDTFNGAVATLAKVSLSQVASSHAGIALSVATGAVTVSAGTPVGPYTLQYRICEIATPSNCDEAAVAVAVQPLPIYAGPDSGRGSSKVANTVVANVLTNDRLGNAPATLANVSLAFVSLTPANNKIRLDLTDGSVDVLGKTDSGVYSLVYEICEKAMPTNCARGTVRIDLSGSGS